MNCYNCNSLFMKGKHSGYFIIYEPSCNKDIDVLEDCVHNGYEFWKPVQEDPLSLLSESEIEAYEQHLVNKGFSHTWEDRQGWSDS